MTNPHPYAKLTPEVVLDALDAVGIHGDGRLLALNSYENRVYQVWREDEPPVVAKFYRPGRWSDAQIAEEHEFVAELAAYELPVVAPLVLEGATVHSLGGFRVAVYPRRGGRAPELDASATLAWIGRFSAHPRTGCDAFVLARAGYRKFGEVPRTCFRPPPCRPTCATSTRV